MHTRRNLQPVVLYLDDLNGETNDTITKRVAMNKYEHCGIIVALGTVGTSGTITFQQDTNLSGSSADKDLNFTKYATQDQDNSPQDAWTEVDVAESNQLAFAGTDDGVAFMFEFSAKDLDAQNNFDILTITVTLDSASNSRLGIFALMQRGRYMQRTEERVTP